MDTARKKKREDLLSSAEKQAAQNVKTQKTGKAIPSEKRSTKTPIKETKDRNAQSRQESATKTKRRVSDDSIREAKSSEGVRKKMKDTETSTRKSKVSELPNSGNQTHRARLYSDKPDLEPERATKTSQSSRKKTTGNRSIDEKASGRKTARDISLQNQQASPRRSEPFENSEDQMDIHEQRSVFKQEKLVFRLIFFPYRALSRKVKDLRPLQRRDLLLMQTEQEVFHQQEHKRSHHWPILRRKRVHR